MNRLIIIGNGFDLAHGLKTRYSDFMLDYLKKILKDNPFRRGGYYGVGEPILGDDFINLYAKREIPYFEPFSYENEVDLSSLLAEFGRRSIKIGSPLVFVNQLIYSMSINNWVDVENEYFLRLRENNLVNNRDEIIKLNESFSILRTKFLDYLFSVKTEVDKTHRAFNQYRDIMYGTVFRSVNEHLHTTPIVGNVLMLNFNYTNTVDIYIQEAWKLGCFAEEIQIHGELDAVDNPVIFGYGDDHHEDYHKMENHNEREYMINMKSMHYSKTNNYELLLHFLNTGNLPKRESKYRDIEAFQVLVLGHSCGLSDRTMLKTIFEHPNCKEIHLAYHGNEEDHFYKTIEVSRHFSDKAEMRRKLKSINKYLMMPQFQKSIQSS
jgi:Bacteriophage abortive infection AbiH